MNSYLLVKSSIIFAESIFFICPSEIGPVIWSDVKYVPLEKCISWLCFDAIARENNKS